MKRMVWLCALALLTSRSFAVVPTDGTTAATPTAGQVLDEWVTSVERQVVSAAVAMPEDKYGFAPRNGDFAGVRNFGEQIKHLAATNYQLGSRVLEEEPPAGTIFERAPDSVKTKAQILEYLQGSFACLHRAAAAVNERNLTEPLPGSEGARKPTRLGLMVDALAHSSNHYGQMVEYLRMNGIVPPASR